MYSKTYVEIGDYWVEGFYKKIEFKCTKFKKFLWFKIYTIEDKQSKEITKLKFWHQPTLGEVQNRYAALKIKNKI